MPQLVEVDGPRAGRTHALPYGVHVVGRGIGRGVRLDHEDVSRRHAKLEVTADGVRVHDLGSKNGVWVGGQRIGAPVMLVHDDRFSLGELTLQISHPASQVTRALAMGGETTATSHRPLPTEPEPEPVSLVLPLLGVVVFGVLVVLMWLQG
ncbi:FHA domain-containing protein [Paraliomyxa miuraensis]|uniref:FHA domain-containing protein n=1 Tax=Paraliomyxa miuraensis TaxID=376150 RepID=UPI002256B44E|nr:FHA domain-containing protein [Paraliomyxa miuraensis]MCX4241895.1 FHA domain-containing protein [Paraliomyxa miuraensis]